MDDGSRLDSVAVALCRVEGSLNVGAACRAMKAMGVTRLVLAACPAFDEVEVRTNALQAFDVYEAAPRFASLGEAAADFSVVAGFTRRVGQRRKENVGVEAFAAAAAERAGASTLLVFGNERDGLSDAELALCDEAVGIPSSDLFPSLNLSHAVQIACWELRKRLGGPAPEGRIAAARSATERSARAVADALQSAGFFKIAGRPEAEAFIRSVAARAALSEAELERYSSLFIKLGALSSALDRAPRR